MRRTILLLVMLAGFTTSARAVGISGLNAARDGLAREFTGVVVRCRADILAATPTWSWDVMTTGTPKGPTYPNHTQPVAFEARSLAQIREFDVRNGGIRVLITTPGFDLKRMGRVGWDALDWSSAGRADRHREVRETRAKNVQCVFLVSDDASTIRQSLLVLFTLAGEEAPDDGVAACLTRHADAPRSVAEALCGMNGADAIAFRGRERRRDVAETRPLGPVAYSCGGYYHDRLDCGEICTSPMTLPLGQARASGRPYCWACRARQTALRSADPLGR